MVVFVCMYHNCRLGILGHLIASHETFRAGEEIRVPSSVTLD